MTIDPTPPADPAAIARRVLDLDNDALPGPWKAVHFVVPGTAGLWGVTTDRGDPRDEYCVTEAPAKETSTLIAAYRTLAPQLARAVLDLAGERGRLRAALCVVRGSIRTAREKEDDAPASATAHLLEAEQVAALVLGEEPPSVYPPEGRKLRSAVAGWERLNGEVNRLRADRDRLAARVAELEAAMASCRDALRYGGVGEPYPFDRLSQLLDYERAKCGNQDDRDYWRYLAEKLTAAAAALGRPAGEGS